MGGVSIHAVHYRILNAVASTIENARLTESPRIVIEKRFQERQRPEANTISVSRAPEQYQGGTMGAYQIGFPAVLVMMRGTGGAARENEATVSEWRWHLHTMFADKRNPIADLGIPGVTPVICRVDPGEDFLDEFWKARWDANHMLVVCYIRKLLTTL